MIFTGIRKASDIWYPNLEPINCHSSAEVKNSEKVTISPNGDVFVHKRTTTECYCFMDLHAFPMDTQRCPFRLEGTSEFNLLGTITSQ